MKLVYHTSRTRAGTVGCSPSLRMHTYNVETKVTTYLPSAFLFNVPRQQAKHQLLYLLSCFPSISFAHPLTSPYSPTPATKRNLIVLHSSWKGREEATLLLHY